MKIHVYCIILVRNLYLKTIYGVYFKVDLGQNIEKWFSPFKTDPFQII